MSTTMVIIIGALVVIAIALMIFAASAKKRRLRSKFGPEFHRLVDQTGDARKADSILAERQKRVKRLDVRPLTPEESAGFANEWHSIQERFVDEPRLAVWQADALLNRALLTRGYPMGDFEQQAANISAEHPHIVENYRIAHDIAVLDQQGRATTEELRRAMQHYRYLFEHAMDTHLVRA